jgi:hypothetical protein
MVASLAQSECLHGALNMVHIALLHISSETRSFTKYMEVVQGYFNITRDGMKEKDNVIFI